MYDFKKIEKKWQDKWNKQGVFNVKEDSDKEKLYLLAEFPYPSGTGLHVGHVRVYTATDVLARVRKAQGYNVLFPMGWDAFGNPAEQYAIKNHIHPKDAVRENIKTFKGQMQSLGLSVDWNREFSTTDPEYYKWTQWQFLKFYNAGMAYKSETEINWCPKCKTVLSNEDSQGGLCVRCETPTTKKTKSQWILKMKSYADKLLDGLNDTEFLEKIKVGQINWIGKSVGAEVDFKIKEVDEKLTVFTTRCDTLYGATFMVISPEHPILDKYKTKIKNISEVEVYQKEAKTKSEIERTDVTKEKTGVCIDGLTGINPVNGKEVPIYISDYVLMNYGTGAIMAVPAHDERDYAFATKFNIPIIQVLEGGDITKEAYVGDGKHINSDILNGMDKETAIKTMLEFLEKNKCGKKCVNYRLQDWVFGRQRFWGEPIPMIHCDECGWVPVPEKDLPVILPNVANYEPTANGESPLADIEEFVNCKCPKCGKDAKRETDTMPNWAGSSWYFLRYMDPHNDKEIASKEALNYWGQVDYYDGGMEHVTRHLLYARFWNIFMHDQGIVPYSEPFLKRISHGMILGENGEKMSKSKGNVINPDDMIKVYGADALRLYEMFIGDYTKDAAWNMDSLNGCKKFLDRVERIGNNLNEKEGYTKNLEIKINQTIKKVTEDLTSNGYNTAVSSLMILQNTYEKEESITKNDYRILLQLLNPLAPHLTEELNERYNLGEEFCVSSWPAYDENKLLEDTYTMIVQVNGKVRGKLEVNTDIGEGEMKTLAKEINNVKVNIEGKEIVKEIVVPKKLVNIVVK